jgi:short-subunit dehydrogenase
MSRKRRIFRKSIYAAGVMCGAIFGLRSIMKRLDTFDFRQKIVLITGGSRGLGLELSMELIRRGANPILLSRSNDELQRARMELSRISENEVGTYVCDIRNKKEVEETITQIIESYGAIDVLINNAGIIQVGPCEEMKIEDFENAMNVHFWGPLYFMLAVIPHMLKQGQGRIVNIASVGGKVAVPHLTPYSASKFALVGLSDGMRAEMSSRGIHITTVCPGLMRTGSHVNAMFKGKNHKEFTWFAISAATPLISMDSNRAARKILNATSRKQPALDLGLPTRMLIIADAIAPSIVGSAMMFANQLMPKAVGENREAKSGWESKSRWAPSIFTRLADREIVPHNELGSPSEQNVDTKS